MYCLSRLPDKQTSDDGVALKFLPDNIIRSGLCEGFFNQNKIDGMANNHFTSCNL